ncbi:hypothetical protein D3C75_820110 [compost metagenome]
MPRSLEPLPADQVPPLTPRLPTGSLQDAWQDIAHRLELARDWNALVRVRDYLHARGTQRLQAAGQ